MRPAPCMCRVSCDDIMAVNVVPDHPPETEAYGAEVGDPTRWTALGDRAAGGVPVSSPWRSRARRRSGGARPRATQSRCHAPPTNLPRPGRFGARLPAPGTLLTFPIWPSPSHPHPRPADALRSHPGARLIDGFHETASQPRTPPLAACLLLGYWKKSRVAHEGTARGSGLVAACLPSCCRFPHERANHAPRGTARVSPAAASAKLDPALRQVEP